ncbi:MAG: oligoendopeptidase F [Clostridia bacterium]|nr:oligoendopeptidase F [Clostridia bacterium]
MAHTIPTRDEVPSESKWNLGDIYESIDAWKADFAKVTACAEQFSAWNGRVASAPDEAIRAFFALQDAILPVVEYAFLSREIDNASVTSQELYDQAMGLIVKANTVSAFFEPELLSLPEETLLALSERADLKDYDTYVRRLIREKKHTLSKEEEQLLASMGEVLSSADQIFSVLTSVDLKFPDVSMPDGSLRPLTEGNYGEFRESPDVSVRRQAFENIFGGYEKLGTTFAAIYATSVKRDVTMAEVRHYSSALASRMEPLEIPEKVYTNLIKVMHESLPMLEKYLRLRKKLMGLDTLHMYDLYPPLLKDFTMKLPFDEAFDLVLEGLRPMGDDYLDMLRRAKSERWMDVYPTLHKSSGAFSDGSLAQVHPYVLLNHNDNLDSAFTIAHELGHSMHSYYSNTSQPAPKRDYSLFVAEVASTCNEATMLRTLLNKYDDPMTKAYLLNHFLEQFRTTCFRQTMFAEFEKTVHEMAQRREPLTKEALNQVYLDLNRTYYGSVCEIDPLIANEWMRIPHFYNAFYVYVYATGLCAAVALSDKIIHGGAEALSAYRRFLSAGSSVPPIEALKLAGIDMSEEAPLRAAMKVFGDTLDAFEAIMEEIGEKD